jgi:pimeloyl-ACP methyl ester carboxylesterase
LIDEALDQPSASRAGRRIIEVDDLQGIHASAEIEQLQVNQSAGSSTTSCSIGFRSRGRLQRGFTSKASRETFRGSSSTFPLAERFSRRALSTSKNLADRTHTKLVYWNEVPRGGHFAAFEQPEIFVAELRKSFAQSR